MSGRGAMIPRVAVKLSAEQERTIRDAWDAGDEVGATPMERLAAVMTIGVEANYKNVRYGDRDSQGAFQQRPSQGWGTLEQITNVKHAAKSFYKTAKQMRQAQQFKRAGDLAAAVQRPAEAYRGRYEGKRSEALEIINQLGLGRDGGGTSKAGAGTGLAAALTGGDPSVQAFDADRGLVSGLEIDRAARAQVPVTAPTSPVAAGPAMPAGYGGAPSAGAPPAPLQADPQQLPDYSTSFGGEQEAAAAVPGSDSSTSDEAPATSGKRGKPRVKIAGGANRAGAPMSKGILNLLDEISMAGNRELVVGTGTNHSKMTTSGNVSEHYEGNGADIPATGTKLTDIGVDSLLATGRGKTVQWLRNDGKVVNVRVTAANARTLVKAGGIFNVPHGKGGRVQVIANTHQGGDHTNHVHVGLREG